ncbi:MAG: hypothetical protein IT428_05125 [Planctomycetaceae bacterium]|nr:hypothetical protein [Planctomycetaceae bacterium]
MTEGLSPLHSPGVAPEAVGGEAVPVAKAPAESGWSRAARRVAGRTTDLVAIGIVAVTALMVGGRLSEWWSTEPSDLANTSEIARRIAGSPTNWGGDGRPVTMEFGGLTQTLRRETFAGTEKQLVERLVAWCGKTVHETDLPTTPPTPAEDRLAAKLRHLKPSAEIAGRGRVYQWSRPSRIVFGTKAAEDPGTPAKFDGKRLSPLQPQPDFRVVCWGMAFPQGKDVWTLFLSGSTEATDRTIPLPSIKMPEGCERLLSLRNDAGEAMLAFGGTADLAEARIHFDRWFRENAWRATSEWREFNGRWTIRYVTPRSETPIAGWTGAVDLEIHQEAATTVSGLINFVSIDFSRTPSTSHAPDKP